MRRVQLAVSFLALLVTSTAAQAALITRVDKSTGFTINNDLRINSDGRLILPDGTFRMTFADQQYNRTNFFTSERAPVNQFHTSFSFTSVGEANGIAFVLNAGNPTRMGNSGGGLTYQGIPNSLAVGFEYYNYDLTKLGINGVFSTDRPALAIDLNSGRRITVNLNYDGRKLVGTVTDGITTLGLDYGELDIPQLIGSPTAHIGMSAAAGYRTAQQDLHSFTYTVVPEPASLLLSLIAIPLLRRRR